MHTIPPIASPLLAWYSQHARSLPWRDDPFPYAVWVSEIMLQQTRVEAVKPFFDRFLQELPTIKHLAQADEQTLLKLWEGLGYYSRVRNLQKAAQVVVQKYGGQLPASFEDLKQLPGIGDYTAGAIASIAFQLPVPAVDGNVLRVMTRLTADDRDITKPAVKKDYFQRISEILQPLARSGDFNQALMDLGATICLPNGLPKCGQCPVSHLCRAFGENRTMDFPVKPEKKPRKIEKRTVFLLVKDHKVALRQRETSGLLAGLWEFPQVEGSLTVKAAAEQLKNWGIEYQSIQKARRHKHIFSHIEWHMGSYTVLCEGSLLWDSAFVWVSQKELQQTFPLPAAFQPFVSEIPW